MHQAEQFISCKYKEIITKFVIQFWIKNNKQNAKHRIFKFSFIHIFYIFQAGSETEHFHYSERFAGI